MEKYTDATLPPEVLVGLRYAIAIIGPYVSTYFPAGSWEQIASLIPSIVAVIYAIVINRRQRLAERAAAAAPKETAAAVVAQAPATTIAEIAKSPVISQIVTATDRLAAVIPSTKVVGPGGA